MSIDAPDLARDLNDQVFQVVFAAFSISRYRTLTILGYDLQKGLFFIVPHPLVKESLP